MVQRNGKQRCIVSNSVVYATRVVTHETVYAVSCVLFSQDIQAG